MPIESLDQAVEWFYEAPGEDEYAVCLEFLHETMGFVVSIAGAEFATLQFNPDYESKYHTTLGFSRAVPASPLTSDRLIFVDDTDVLSSVGPDHLITVVDAALGLRHILEHHECPEFLNWR
jgi:hypothetical protein